MKPQRFDDIRLVSLYTGKIIIGTGMLMAVPMAVSLIFMEWDVAIDFLIGIGTALVIGYGLAIAGQSGKEPTWIHGMVAAASSWLVAMVVCAVPYWLSGQYLSFLDGMFDVMSGFTTTGLTLIQDLDHVSVGLNMWRHLITFVGGQGIVVLALMFLVGNTAGGYKLYVGEAKDERLLPSVFHTAAKIWQISLIYLGLGTAVLWLAGVRIGLPAAYSFLHGLWIFMAAWSTGGFAPTSMNILFYHSTLYELITIVLFVAGSFNFALHYAVWTGKRDEIYKNIETLSFTVTLCALTVLGCYGLAELRVYPDAVSLFRKGFYQIISGHTTTGYMTIYARQFIREWGDTALLAISISMLIGGSACSTAGGFKGFRMGIVFKAVMHEIRRLVKPEAAVIVQRFHHIEDQILRDKHVRGAALIIILYMLTFGATAVAGVLSGFPLTYSVFESASVTGNVGLSCGLTSAVMPVFLKLVYIFSMWVGRLEFISVLVLFSFVFSGVRGRN